MGIRNFAGLALLSLLGCAFPEAHDGRAGAQAAADHERVLALVEQQNRLLSAELGAERFASAERAELSRRVEELARENRELAQTVARLDREPERDHAKTAAPAQATSLVDTSDAEVARLRVKLVEAGFNPVTLTPAQVRALVRTLRPPRPIDVESPFAL